MPDLKPSVGQSGPKDTEEYAKSLLEKEGWDITYDFKMKRENTEHLIEASINRDNWEINITVDPEYEKKMEEFCLKENVSVPQPSRKTLYSVTRHEYGHWDVCPFDAHYYEGMLDGITKGLKEGGVEEEKAKEYGPHATNMFMDIIVNTSYGCNDEEFLPGRAIKYTIGESL